MEVLLFFSLWHLGREGYAYFLWDSSGEMYHFILLCYMACFNSELGGNNLEGATFWLAQFIYGRKNKHVEDDMPIT